MDLQEELENEKICVMELEDSIDNLVAVKTGC